MLSNDYVVEERLSAWQKKKVRTIIVNSRSRLLSRRTIAGAIAIAKPYERIELVGGEYFETLSINIPLEIVAAEGEDPCIFSRGTCMTLTQDVEVYFEHIEFMSKSKSKLEPSVALLNGRSVFFRCKMNSVLVGGFAKTHLEHCTITESFNGYGLQIGDSGSAEVQQCTIHTHHLACVEIDTKGVVMMRESSFRQPSNGGDVVSVRAKQSSTDEYASPENLACRRVTVTKCHIYVTSDFFKPKDREWLSENASGQPSCVVISRGACPVFTYNELLQGFIGFTLDFAGSAVLEGNCIYNQKVCAILVIVGDRGISYESKSATLRISGGNLIDRCFIGVDVQSSGKFRLATALEEPTASIQEIPSCRASFSWLDRVRISEGKEASSFSYDDTEKTPVRVGATNLPFGQLKEQLRSLVKAVCAAYYTHFHSGELYEGRHGGELNPFGELLEETLSMRLPPLSEAAGEFLRPRILSRVEILDTRFTSCGLCAIRFGHDRHGLVEDCDFVRCGATAIVVGSGAHPLIVGCKFNESKGAGILVENFANPLIIGNEMLSNTEHGVEFCNMARGVLIGNIIASNAISGISVKSGSYPIIAGNSIKQSGSAGVISTGGSEPFIIMNKFASNRNAQLLVSDFSTPFIACNTFAASSGTGLHFESCSGGTVLNNTILNNDQGIVLELDADPYVVSNKIMGSGRYGVSVENNGLGTFLSNEISNSRSCNMVVQEGGLPVIRKNTVSGGQSGGVVVIAEGLGSIEHNCITENATGNVIVLDRFTQPLVAYNTISCSTSGGGIICGRECDGQFIQNTIFQNKECGVYVIGKANPMISNNTIFCEAIGVIVSYGGRGVFKGNNIHSSYSTGIVIQSGGVPVIQGNKVSKCFISGLLVALEGSGIVSENDFFENDVGVQLGSSLGVSELEVAKNLMGNNPSSLPMSNRAKLLRPHRVLISRESNETGQANLIKPTDILKNKIYANTTSGVLLESKAYGVMEDNDIESNVMYGVLADVRYSAKRVSQRLDEMAKGDLQRSFHAKLDSGCAIIRKNRICRHKHSNVAILDYGENDISIALNDMYESPIGVYVANNSTISSINGNTIRNCYDGVYAESKGRGCFEENKIHDCDGVGVYVCDGANPQFISNNSVERCKISGVFVDSGGCGTFSQTSVRHCTVGVVVYTSPSISSSQDTEKLLEKNFVATAPIFRNCVIEKNTLHGVLVISVVTGCSLRFPSSYLSTTRYPSTDIPIENSMKASNFAKFHENIIQNNRHFGVCHEFYNPHDLEKSEEGDFSKGNVSMRLEQTTRNPFSPKKDLIPNRARLSSTYSARQFSSILESRSLFLYAMQENSGGSSLHNSEKHYEECMQRQVSFVGNLITNCSIGVVIGSGCNPFFLNNRIHNNTFFGMLFRPNARAICYGCELVENGLAGLYVARHSLGAFTAGLVARNNGFCRPDGSPNDPRSFEKFPFMQPVVTIKEPCFESNENLHDSYSLVWNMLEKYADVVADGLQLLCEIVSASSTSLSLATGVSPAVSFDNGMKSFGLLSMDGYDHGWVVDGGIGAWVEQESMTDVRNNLVEGNRNIGVLFSRGIYHHHQNLMHFVDISGVVVPVIPGSEVIFGTARNARDDILLMTLFATTSLIQKRFRVSLSNAESNRKNSNLTLPLMLKPFDDAESFCNTSGRNSLPLNLDVANDVYEKPVALRCPAVVGGNRITKNGQGIVMHMFHVMKAHAIDEGKADIASGGILQQKRPELGTKVSATRKVKNVKKKQQASTLPDVNARKPLTSGKKKNTETRDVVFSRTVENSYENYHAKIEALKMDEVQFSVCMEENHVYENIGIGICCQHVVEVLCGHLVRSRLELDVAARQYNDVCVKITIRNELMLPNLLFKLVPHERKTCNAKFSENEVYKNVGEQMQVTSRYVAVTQDGNKTLLQIDTMHQPNASMCSSQALLRIPLFASLTMAAPPGILLVEKNRFHDSSKGIHLLGLLGGTSTCICNNAFTNIAGNAILLEGHLASATIGKENVFESNGVSIRFIMPKDLITEEDRQKQEEMGIRTCVYGNFFSAAKNLSVIVDGGGSSAPNFSENTFYNHSKGSPAFFISGSSTNVRLRNNVFRDNYVPVIITNTSGVDMNESNAVVVEKNHFLRNYIGLLVCGGANAHVKRNLFEANCRAGLEVMGEGTKVFLEYCLFMMHKKSDFTSSEAEGYEFPENGEFKMHDIWGLSVKLSPESMSPDGNSAFSAGILIDSVCGGTVSRCLFMDNDIGVDVICDTVSSSGVLESSLSSSAQFASCLFTKSGVAGVWVRGVSGKGKTNSSSGNTSSVNQLSGNKSLPTRSLAEGGGESEEILFDGCFFMDNTCDNQHRGDVVSVDGGFASFRGNMFGGCIHGKREGACLFERNTFLYLGSASAAVYLHKATRIRLIGNIIRGQKKGVVTFPGAWGKLERNWILDTAQSVFAAPFCHTLFTGNRMTKAKECGIMAFGGVFMNNEISACSRGVVIQNPIEYKDYELIPAFEKTTFDTLLSENRVHSCDSVGIIAYGGARIEGNAVFNNKNNINVLCRPNQCIGTSIANITKNAFFDGDIGVLVSKGSESIIRENDIFDNSVLGISIQAGASGVLQGNNISTSMRDGALEVETGSEIKSSYNNIRNQFSPVYHKTLPPQREKERQRATEALTLEMQDANRACEELLSRCVDVETAIRSAFDDMTEQEDSTQFAPSMGFLSMDGAASRGLRINPNVRRSSILDLLTPSLRKSLKGQPGEESANTLIKISKLVARKAGSSLSTSRNLFYEVLIHIFSGLRRTADIMKLGKEVETTFLSLQVATRVMFNVSITTNYTELSSFFTSQRPHLVIIVLQFDINDFTEEVAASSLKELGQLQSQTSSRKGSIVSFTPISTFTLLPVGWKTSLERHVLSRRVASPPTRTIVEFAVERNPIYYKHNVSEAVLGMEPQLESQFPPGGVAASESNVGDTETFMKTIVSS